MFAMLSGSSFGGALTMLGFALGTAPSVTAATLGVTQLQRISGTSGARHLVGGALIALGCATFIWPATALGICKF
jgi:sulfite exporter TauE/SafE